MKRRAFLTFGLSILGLAICPAADEKPDPIIGKWNQPKEIKAKHRKVLVFNADFTCKLTEPKNPTEKGKWSVDIESDRSRKYKVVWAGGATVVEYRLSAQDDKIRNHKGVVIFDRLVE